MDDKKKALAFATTMLLVLPSAVVAADAACAFATTENTPNMNGEVMTKYGVAEPVNNGNATLHPATAYGVAEPLKDKDWAPVAVGVGAAVFAGAAVAGVIYDRKRKKEDDQDQDQDQE